MSKKQKISIKFLFFSIIVFVLILIISINLFRNPSIHHNNDTFLNQQEKNWLLKLDKPLKVGITYIPNQVLPTNQEGVYQGFSIDLFREIEKILPIKFQFVFYKTWKEVIDAGKFKEIDIVFLAQKTESRLAFFNFTDTVLSQQNKIIIQSSNHKITHIDDLNQKKVALSSGSAVYYYLQENYPKIMLVPTRTELDALKLVSNHQADAAISESVRASYYIKKENLVDLRIMDDLGYNYNLALASRKDWALLNIILSKAVNHISLETMETLNLKWGYVKDKDYYFDKQTLIYMMIVFSVIFPFSLYLYFINRRLEREGLRREKMIIELNEVYEKEAHLKDEIIAINKGLEARIQEEVSKNQKQTLMMLQQSRLAQMGEIINMIAHQWRQPLNNILLINEIFVQDYFDGKIDSKDVHKFNEETSLLVKHMSYTIDDFRDFFQPRKEKCRFLVNDTIEHLLLIMTPVFRESGIELSVHQEDDIYLFGYSNELAQAILNILNNAKDALNMNNIKEKTIKLVLKKENSRVILTISDNAGGIPSEIIENIFDPYFTTKEKQNGTGIGLYMSKIIVEEHCNGKLSVKNDEHGAVFSMEFEGSLELT